MKMPGAITVARRAWPRLLALGLALVAAADRRSPPPRPPAAPLEDMRLPWQPSDEGYLRQWLVLGEFPNVAHLGLTVDHLAAVGGEAAARPRAGQRVLRPDNSAAIWTKYTSATDVLDLEKAFAGRPATGVVGYAHATIASPRPQRVFLSLGSDDGARVWVNGRQLYSKSIERSALPDDDLIAADLVAGPNHLLIKVEQGTGKWQLVLRVLSPLAATRVASISLTPSIVDPTAAGNRLTLDTDEDTPFADWSRPVRVLVTAAGGRRIAERSVPRGERVSFDTRRWPDGAYDLSLSTEASDGSLERSVLSWYKGDAPAALRGLITSAPRAQASSPIAMTHALLAAMAQDRLGAAGEKGPESVAVDRRRAMASILMEFEELMQAAAGRAAPARAGGFLRLAYPDDIDDSPQFCRAYLPADYDPARRWPLVVNLHGYYPANPPYRSWWRVDQRHTPLADRHHVILLEPHGRGNSNYAGIGERDVLRCMELAQARLSVDPERVYLTGFSMGAGGAWQIAAHRPELFAAIAPVNGGWDYRTLMSPAAREALTPRQRYYQERSSSFAQIESLLNVPVFISHAEHDESVDVNQSRYAARLLERWGYDVRYREHPAAGHTTPLDQDDIVRWLLEHRCLTHPRRVRIRAADLKTAAAYWLRLDQRRENHAFLQADAVVVGPNRIRLDTENVTAVTLSPEPPLVDPTRPLHVAWNDAHTHTVTLTHGRVSLFARGYRPSVQAKSAATEGPLADLETTPFAIVVGTISPDPLMRRLCAQKAALVADAWQRWQHHRPRVFDDTAISEVDIARFSLMLVGGADANRVTRLLSARLPLRVSAGAVVLAGRTFAATDAYVHAIFPHPMNATRYVSVLAGTSAAGLSFFDSLDNETRTFDFYIADGAIADPARGRPLNRVRIASGWFDRDWRIASDLLEIGDPVVRARCKRRGFSPENALSGDGGIALDATTLDAYVGRYQIGNDMLVTLRRSEGKLVAEVPFQPLLSLSARSETEFLVVGTPLRVTFLRDAAGNVSGARVEQPGQWDVVATRLP